MTRCANSAKKINADEFIFRYSDTNEEELKCLFGLLYFRGLYQDTNQPTKELWYDTFSAKKIYRAAMSLNRFKWLERTITFYDHNTVRVDFSKIGLPVWDRFWRNLKKMRGSITGIQNLLWWIKLWETFMFRIIVVLSLYERQTWKFWFFSSSISRCTRPICF